MGNIWRSYTLLAQNDLQSCCVLRDNRRNIWLVEKTKEFVHYEQLILYKISKTDSFLYQEYLNYNIFVIFLIIEVKIVLLKRGYRLLSYHTHYLCKLFDLTSSSPNVIITVNSATNSH
jgi:hypothetical protein